MHQMARRTFPAFSERPEMWSLSQQGVTHLLPEVAASARSNFPPVVFSAEEKVVFANEDSPH